MAEYILDVMSQTSKLDWAFPFQRTGAFPIDRSAVFSSLEDAQKYALGLDSNKAPQDERGLGGTSYVGQVISVYEAGVEANEETGAAAVPASVNAYIITPARGLLKLAATTASGDVTADIAELQGKVNQLISDLETLEGTVDKKADKTYVDEELAKKADTSALQEEVERAQAAEKANADAIALKANDTDVYKKSETYTKSEVHTYVQGQIGSAGHLKREKVDVLPAVGDADVDTIYMVKKAANSQLTGDYYEEYMLIDGAFEMIGNTYVDLSGYATTEYVDNAIDGVEGALADKANQSALDETNEAVALKADKTYVDEELAKKADKTQVATDISEAIAPLAKQADVESALGEKADKSYVDEELAKKADKATTLTGYGITDAYTKSEVDAELLKKASQEDHNELVDVVNGKADKATTLAGYGITDAYTKDQVYTKEETLDKIAEKITEINGGESAGEVLSQLNSYKETNDARVKALEDVGAQANVLEAVKIEGTALEIKDKAVELPLALASKAGLVKSSSAENGVAVAADGTMSVNSVNVNKLVQSEGEYLILNGGGATI